MKKIVKWGGLFFISALLLAPSDLTAQVCLACQSDIYRPGCSAYCAIGWGSDCDPWCHLCFDNEPPPGDCVQALIPLEVGPDGMRILPGVGELAPDLDARIAGVWATEDRGDGVLVRVCDGGIVAASLDDSAVAKAEKELRLIVL